jgi:hypothetical protein
MMIRVNNNLAVTAPKTLRIKDLLSPRIPLFINHSSRTKPIKISNHPVINDTQTTGVIRLKE